MSWKVTCVMAGWLLGCTDPCQNAMAQTGAVACEKLQGPVCLCQCKPGTRPEIAYAQAAGPYTASGYTSGVLSAGIDVCQP